MLKHAIHNDGIGNSLTSLVFDDVYDSKKLYKEDVIPNRLKTCPMLEELTLPQHVMRDSDLTVSPTSIIHRKSRSSSFAHSP